MIISQKLGFSSARDMKSRKAAKKAPIMAPATT